MSLSDGPRTLILRGRVPLPVMVRGRERAIWLLSAAMLVVAAALLTAGGVGGQSPAVTTTRLPLWALVLAFGAAEQCVVHVHFRRSAHSISLGEIPLVFALLFTGGWTAVVAFTVGRVLVLALVRRLPAIRLVFNLGQFALGGVIAVITFHALVGGAGAVDPRVWFAAAAATIAASVFSGLMISAAVSLSEGTLGARRIAATLRTDLTVALANTSMGLCAARLVDNDWRTAILLAVPVLGMYATMRAYANERERHGRLEFLYEAARALSAAADSGEALAGLLARSVEAFRADVAEILFYSPDGQSAWRTTVHADGRTTLLEVVDPALAGRLREVLPSQQRACRCDAVVEPWLAERLWARGLRDGLFAVLHGEQAPIGVIVLGERSGVVDAFGAEDVKLFETLANNTSVALENDRLGHTLWEMEKLQGALRHEATHDALTGLANRALFGERLDAALTGDGGDAPAAVIFLDVNDFKMVNDTLGHAAGDELLVAIAGRLSDCVRPSDTLARLGGDEFAILLGGSEDTAVEIAERIDQRFDDTFAVAGKALTVRASIGIAVGDRDGVAAEELIRNADLAMYRAKQSHAGRYELFRDGMEVPVLRHHGLRQRLREAVDRDAFAVHYQPIVDLRTGAVTAQEALVRWQDGARGCVHPASFIPVAEEMGVITDIGRRVLARACEDARGWQRAAGGPAPAVHVNLSPVELRDDGFLDGVHEALGRTGLAPERLVLEITESVVIADPERCIALLRQLREAGVQLALDDFGTGYSSLSHLRELPLQWLKIGQPFVDELAPGEANRPFMRMILDLAASLDLRVVAEGIETERQQRTLHAMGCGYGQGFLLGEPAPTGGGVLGAAVAGGAAPGAAAAGRGTPGAALPGAASVAAGPAASHA